VRKLENWLTTAMTSSFIVPQQALKKANEEYEKFKKLNRDEISEAEKHFMKQIEQTVQKLDPKKNNHD
jgi:hypothetical protein